jgi:Ni,Fe-hydrogenase I large subunit
MTKHATLINLPQIDLESGILEHYVSSSEQKKIKLAKCVSNSDEAVSPSNSSVSFGTDQ